MILSTLLTVTKLVWGNVLGGWANPGEDEVTRAALSLLMVRPTCTLVGSKGAANTEVSACAVGMGFCRWVEGCVNGCGRGSVPVDRPCLCPVWTAFDENGLTRHEGVTLNSRIWKLSPAAGRTCTKYGVTGIVKYDTTTLVETNYSHACYLSLWAGYVQ